MKHYIFLFVFFIPFFLLFGWVGYLFYTAQTAQQVFIAIKGYDPLDLLSGHYILYEIDWEKTNCHQFIHHICPKQDFAQISHRFYLPEKAAGQIDRLMRIQNSVSPIRFDMIFSYIPHREPIALMLLINNQKWSDYLKNERKN